ncbi:hypothetical protein [Candidatus Binatus sp.]|uniref:hypothetical protein n=1 Tax=Candidatus Binatus sp. TaxID=2811406 RepID=UPI003C764368
MAKGDFQKGLALQRTNPLLRAIELSALRDHELRPLISCLDQLDLSHFDYVSFHAPSKLTSLSEKEAFSILRDELPPAWPIIVHPELIPTPLMWKGLGRRVCLENMDNRKSNGRTLREMRQLFEWLPDAEFCLDLGHARQIDPTMATAMRMAQEFSGRLRQLHVSEIGLYGEHLPLSALAIYAFQLVARFVPAKCAVIIESVVAPDSMDREIRKSASLFQSATVLERSLDAALALTA